MLFISENQSYTLNSSRENIGTRNAVNLCSTLTATDSLEPYKTARKIILNVNINLKYIYLFCP
jgi:hypothetical protein